MYSHVPTAPQHAVKLFHKEAERREKLFVIAAVAHVFQLVGVGVKLGERGREYREAHAFIGHLGYEAHAVAVRHVALAGLVFPGRFGFHEAEGVGQVAVHRFRHGALHPGKLPLLFLE